LYINVFSALDRSFESSLEFLYTIFDNEKASGLFHNAALASVTTVGMSFSSADERLRSFASTGLIADSHLVKADSRELELCLGLVVEQYSTVVTIS